MTDIEKFINLYKSFGIECFVNIDQDKEQFIILTQTDSYFPISSAKETTSKKFTGYRYFHSVVIFSPDGEFLRQEFWE